jgi:hypothetical protein
MKWILFMLAMTGCCGDAVTTTTQQLSEFTKKARKPIIIYRNGMNQWTFEKDYTLIDAEGNVFVTGMMNVTLPDTIK